MGYGLREYAYRQDLLPLIGYLQIGANYTYPSSNKGPCQGHEPEDDEDFPLEAHWCGDECELVDEYSDEWKDIHEYERYGTEYGNNKWTNISKQLWEEYNAYIKDWNKDYEGDSEETKERHRKDIEKMCIPIGPNGAHFD